MSLCEKNINRNYPNNYKIVIPARYQSVRLPGKPLRTINGKPLIEHTYSNAKRTQASEVIVATDDPRIEECVINFGGDCFMTAQAHFSGTDRVNEVAVAKHWDDDTIVVNVQGDEPFILPEEIDGLVSDMASNSQILIGTLASEHKKDHNYADSNKVKVVCDKNNKALEFSRKGISESVSTWWCHHGIYAYKCRYLRRFVQLERPNSEITEKLEQLRAMEVGDYIYVRKIRSPIHFGIDSESELSEVKDLI